MPERVNAAAAVLIATLVALVFAGVLPWLVGQVPLFGPARFAVYVTASVVVPLYVYALHRIAKGALRRGARRPSRPAQTSVGMPERGHGHRLEPARESTLDSVLEPVLEPASHPAESLR